ncbi:uncharacterized protein V1518DRAFT_413756 [Limtongia smithiae]|uniref:uncharacterized protein n=1 Tax=Limtongia smithiae TaxID=1125753 RepID=UPI0034CF448E
MHTPRLNRSSMTFANRIQNLARGNRITAISRRSCVLRFSTTCSSSSLYELFPKTFPQGAPPNGAFSVDPRALRSEFLRLQALTHPDHARTEEDKAAFETQSALLNKAYSTLRAPLPRAVYLLELRQMHVTEDENLGQDPELLMQVYELLERIEECGSEEEVGKVGEEVAGFIATSEAEVEAAFDADDIEAAKVATIRLRYWVNIREALKEWQPGQPFRMVH